MLSFTAFDWFLAESISSLEQNIENVDRKPIAQLLLNIYPQQKTLLHMITAGFNEDDQSRSVAQTKLILEAATNFDGQEIARADSPAQFIIPMIADCEGKTPLQLMNDSKYKALSNTIVDYLQFENIIENQVDVSNILK